MRDGWQLLLGATALCCATGAIGAASTAEEDAPARTIVAAPAKSEGVREIMERNAASPAEMELRVGPRHTIPMEKRANPDAPPLPSWPPPERARPSRAMMAVALLRALDPTFDPPPCARPSFPDVPAASPYCRWIEEAARRGLVRACAGGRYCPDSPALEGEVRIWAVLRAGWMPFCP